MSLEPSLVRSGTLERLRAAAFPSPPGHLPALWELGDVPTLRRVDEVLERIAVLNVIISCSYGMPPAVASDWIAQNGLDGCLTAREERVLAGTLGLVDEDKAQVEAINGLAWSVGMVQTLGLSEFCGDDLAGKLPDLRRAEPMSEWNQRNGARMRNVDEVAAEWDLSYCVTWGLADANLRGVTATWALPQSVYWQRRRSLEYVCAQDIKHRDWDDVDLST